MTETIDSLLAEARRRFLEQGLANAAQDARLLVSGLLGLSSTALLTGGANALTLEQADLVRSGILRRLSHEPVYRILGERDFFGLTLGLSKGTLEPRPDTEILVERLLPFAQDVVARKGHCHILDLGTGTGAICLALLDACPLAIGTGADISEDALATASDNALRNGLADRFTTLQSDWFDAVAGRFDVIVSNPPYIASGVISSLAPDVRNFDPAVALDGGADGLDAYRAIAARAADYMESGAALGLEIGFDQKQAVSDLFEDDGYVLRDAAKDLGGNDRVLIFQRTEAS